MPYAADHKKRTRQRILESAQRLFCSKGFEATSIEEIMLECKLTRGGFYAHFRSKARLYHEAMGNAASWRPAPGVKRSERSARWLDAMLASCMPSFDTSQGPQRTDSPWTFLATDVVSKQPEVRAAYARVFQAMSQRLCREMAQSPNGDNAAMAAMAMAVGALAVAMTIDDAALRTGLINACREHAKTMFDSETRFDRLDFFWATEPRDSIHAPPASPPLH